MNERAILFASAALNLLLVAPFAKGAMRRAASFVTRMRSKQSAAPAPHLSVCQDFADGPEYAWRAALFESEPAVHGAIVFLGDSLTEGGMWQLVWRNKLLTPVLNRGIAGDSAEGVRRRLWEIVRHRPRDVLLMIGINDILWANRPAEYVFGKVADIVRELTAALPTTSIHILSVLPALPQHAHTIRQLNARLRSIAQTEPRTRFVDLHSAATDAAGVLRPDLSHDGVHLTAKGYELWRAAVWPIVSEGVRAAEEVAS